MFRLSVTPLLLLLLLLLLRRLKEMCRSVSAAYRSTWARASAVGGGRSVGRSVLLLFLLLLPLLLLPSVLLWLLLLLLLLRLPSMGPLGGCGQCGLEP